MPNHLPSNNRYDEMFYRPSGRSGLKLPAISLGLWQNFGAVDPFRRSREMVLRAFDLGITHFDLANNYGPPPGSAETNFGKILHQDLAHYRDEMVISTKAGWRMWPGPYGEWGSRKYLLSSLDQSLKRMRIEYVDIFYLHRPDPGTPLEESMSALDSAVRSGKALYAGVSSLGVEDTRKAAAILRSLGTPCLIHQPVYNMFNRWIEDGLLDLLREEGIGCIAFSPLAQGLLSNKYLQGIPRRSRAARPDATLSQDDISGEKLKSIRTLNEIAEGRGQSLPQMALAWILRHDVMTAVLTGTSRLEQLEENVASLEKLDFTADELRKIDAALAR
ncbi:MAG: L-glyceraldehyde 3-phosphate reductase [Ignavibacteria bacterium]|nr:MAG: L-glyceraldehyde 3-phosphate reductase [Ignavibacteria bacterium]